MHRLALFSWCSIFIYLLSPAFALPTGGNNLRIYTIPDHVTRKDITNQACEASAHYCRRGDLGASDVTTLARRRFVRLDFATNWYVVYEAFGMFFPAERMIPALETFYSAFEAQVRTDWSNTPALDHIKIRQGMLELEFWNPNGVIPWPWVSVFANILLKLARQGQSGAIEAVFFDSMGGNIVVAQRIYIAAAAA
ncbi:MAG: hypothetical protein HETSPECPRED_008755 [Heterodermia speciosa]|uniref:Uncharacterized protein n=1 Tax=Heterodermia speciosa TaxID=116794 RepID=A0A8H3ERE1_9LECA|nr:MAG: hypothetical protein HETSPECPRED_008755 [Heterodermia speciosa]